MYDGDSYSVREPVKVLTDVKDMAMGDFYAAAVRTDGSLQVWGRQDGYQSNQPPITIRTGVEKVFIYRDVLFFLDGEHNLYYYEGGGDRHLEEFLEEPVLLDTEMEDLYRLNFMDFFKLKTDGTVELPDYQDIPRRKSRVLARDGVQINQSGYVSADGAFHQVEVGENDGPILITPLESAYSVYNINGDSIHLLQNGEIRVCFTDN